MSYNVDNIIPFQARISPAGLGFANFAEAVIFAPESELPSGFNVDTYRVYNNTPGVAADFAVTTETYKVADKWLGGIPSISKVKIWAVADADTNWTETMNKARNAMWWYWSFFTKDVYASSAAVTMLAEWHSSNYTYFMNCQVGSETAKIRDPNESGDISTTLTTGGYRFASTLSHATDPYAGVSLCKHFAKVNYSAERSTITGEFKKLHNVPSESLKGTEYAAMKLPTKKCVFYTTVELQGSVDIGRVINTFTHSSYGEYIDDVVNLSAFSNFIEVSLYNSIANQVTKLGQDPIGQSVIIDNAKLICEQFIKNNYLGPRNYIDPDDGITKYTAGYEILTKPGDILNLLEPNRDAREAAPLRIRIFRKGAIHKAPVDVDVY